MLIFSRPLILGALYLAAFATPSLAQPEVPTQRTPQTEKPPIINADAKNLVDAMVAKYAGLTSYSAKVRLMAESDAVLLDWMHGQFPLEGSLAWQRPERLRFEGTMATKPFLALSDDTTIRVFTPKQQGVWLERLQHPPLIVNNPDGTKTIYPPAKAPARLSAALMDLQTPASAIAFMTESDSWAQMLKDVTVLVFEPDDEIEEEPCRVVNIQIQQNDGNVAALRLWIARSDNFLRRLESGSRGIKIVETHSQVRANPDLPASTWQFQAPTGATPVERFGNRVVAPHERDPNIKLGDTLPTFSGDDLNGQPLELNAKSGRVTIVQFFEMNGGDYSLRTLQKLQNTVGADKLQVVAVSGDALQGRLKTFATKNKIALPIYYDDSATLNPIAQKFGVKSWPSLFVFGADGKLKLTYREPSGPDFEATITKLLPGTPLEAFIPPMLESPNAPN